MTKVRLNQWGRVYVHVVLDWYTKEIVGTSVSITSKTDDWLNALNYAVNTRFPDGILAAKHRLSLVTDNGCQPTAQRFSSPGLNKLYSPFLSLDLTGGIALQYHTSWRHWLNQ